jgi:hypothetical protein
MCGDLHNFAKVVFWNSSIIYISIKLQRFRSWVFFRLQVKKERTETLAVELASDLDSFNIEVPGARNGEQ